MKGEKLLQQSCCSSHQGERELQIFKRLLNPGLWILG